MSFRRATLDDAQAISRLFRSQIARWQRIDAQGNVQDLPYEELSIYERWLHGGAWMSLETGAIWLSHLLRGAGEPFVLEQDGIVAYAELYHGDEPSVGQSVHIGEMLVAENAPVALRETLLKHLMNQAADATRITASCTAYDQDSLNFYNRYALEEISRVHTVTLSGQVANVGFYKVAPYSHPDATQITGWHMPLGRTQSARQHWEQLWPAHWDAVPQITARRTDRLQFSSAGQNAFVCVQQHLYNPRSAEAFCWTPKPLSSQLLAAIRDWSYKQGYRSLTVAVDDRVRATLGNEAEASPQQYVILGRAL